MRPNDATLRQIEAADPSANTWLSANAGSGKTRVLTDRVARLLLSEVSPQNILCLTYTKAAASEMQNRLFKRLGSWAMKPDAELRAELRELGVEEVGDLALARRLFAGAIETPGGLKIQTIHSFCASILRRFPLEAGVTPQFTEMDERSAKLLQAEVVEDMASGPTRDRLAALAAFYTGEDFSRLTAEIVGRRMAFAHEAVPAEIWSWFDLPDGFAAQDLLAEVFAPGDPALLKALVPVLLAGSKTDAKAGEKFATLDLDRPGLAELEVLESILLTGSGAKAPFSAKIGSFPTKATREKHPHLIEGLNELMERVEAARNSRISLYSAQKTLVLHRFARPFLAEYETRKQARGWLDFDDLILRAGQLLNDPGLAAWVLYRLDGGIDHILVDEAQDTSPEQWRVIESLAREFTAGESARSDRPRTLFVVGDQKQSIYSFQGADPAEFSRMRVTFDSAFRDIGSTVNALQLEYSFRSAHAVLDLVDRTLETAAGLGDERVLHRAFDLARPGRVDLWPVVEKPEKEPDKPWTDPLDTPAPDDERVVLARAVADAIAGMLKTGSITGKNGEISPIRAGDVMVLVRRRSEIFHEIIRACKALGLPIAGADRLRIGGELAVKDLTAVLAFLATPEDDLSLAAALRSPLFGLSEDALFRLAHGRGGRYLWSVLRKSTEHSEAVAILTDLRDEADFLRPYDLIDRILTRHDGRRRLIARLGTEAEDGIDALLSQALGYERMEVPSLTGFLTWLAAEEVEIKRQLDSAGDRIRVMTVHGAKGLEAPVVILPDTAKRRPNNRDQTAQLAGGEVVWRSGKDAAPEALAEALEAERDRAQEEDMRLLYVAMTRAESWLIVAGAGDVGEAGESWYRIVEAGMEGAGAVAQDFALGPGLRAASGDWPEGAERGEIRQATPIRLPDWAFAHSGVPEKPPGPLVPSDLGGAKIVAGAEAGEDLEAALRHGRQLHRLLEFLPGYPRPDWDRIAEDLLAFGEDAASPAEAADLLREARRVLEAPELGMLFGPETLAEVEISAPMPDGGRIHGVIDRLVVTPETVLAVDFKTNRAVPDTAEGVPEGILRQMGAYETALAAVYPGRRIETAVLWTATGALTRLPPGLALRAFGRLDVTEPGS